MEKSSKLVVDARDLIAGCIDPLERRKSFCRFDRVTNCIYIRVSESGAHEYEVDLDRCKTSGQALDWIHQISEKTFVWDRPETMLDFLEMLFERIDTKLWASEAARRKR